MTLEVFKGGASWTIVMDLGNHGCFDFEHGFCKTWISLIMSLDIGK